MWPAGVELLAPHLQHHLGFLERVEDLAVEQFVSELAVERFTVAVLPGTAGHDVERLAAYALEPGPEVLRDHLRAVVGADVIRDTVLEHQVSEHLKHLVTADAPGGVERQTASCVLVDDDQDLDGSPVVGTVHDEVPAPDVVGPLGPQADAASVAEPQAPPARLFLRYFEPLLLPDALDPRPGHTPALGVEQGRNPTVAVAAVLARQAQDRLGQGRFILPRLGDIAKAGTVDGQRPADASFRAG